MVKDFIEKKFSKVQRRNVRNFLNDIRASFVPGNLNQLARIYKTDKWGEHRYTPHYKTHLKKYRFKKINLLEIGVGGYEEPLAGGFSLRMWKKYFPFGKIYSVDIHDKSPLQEKRIKIYQGSQVDLNLLDQIVHEIGTIDVIIDDGSHINEHVITTFKHLFPKLKDGGVYVIEDTQTSYWEDFGGSSENLNDPKTMMNFFKNLTDSVNFMEFTKANYEPTYYDLHITSIHFYHNLIFIHKNLNDELSNKDMNQERLKNK
jgi:demethylmacrocin O-methyltransferase